MGVPWQADKREAPHVVRYGAIVGGNRMSQVLRTISVGAASAALLCGIVATAPSAAAKGSGCSLPRVKITKARVEKDKATGKYRVVGSGFYRTNGPSSGCPNFLTQVTFNFWSVGADMPNGNAETGSQVVIPQNLATTTTGTLKIDFPCSPMVGQFTLVGDGRIGDRTQIVDSAPKSGVYDLTMACPNG